MPRNVHVNLRAIAYVLFLCCGAIAWASQYLPILDTVIAQSRLLSNSSAATQKDLLKCLAHIERAPSSTPLRVVHELEHGRLAQTFLDVMEVHKTINDSSIVHWFESIIVFLDRCLLGSCLVHHGDLILRVNQTAVSGLPMMRRSILAKLATAWLTTLGGRIPEAALGKLAQVMRKVRPRLPACPPDRLSTAFLTIWPNAFLSSMGCLCRTCRVLHHGNVVRSSVVRSISPSPLARVGCRALLQPTTTPSGVPLAQHNAAEQSVSRRAE